MVGVFYLKFAIVSPVGFDCGFQYNIIKRLHHLNHNAAGGWGGAWGDVIHAALHIQLVFTHGPLHGIDQSFI